MSKDQLENILRKACSKELQMIEKAQDRLDNDPSLAEFIDIDKLHQDLSIKVVRTCIELVRTGKETAEKIGFLLSLQEIENGFIADMETYQQFLYDYDGLVRDN